MLLYLFFQEFCIEEENKKYRLYLNFCKGLYLYFIAILLIVMIAQLKEFKPHTNCFLLCDTVHPTMPLCITIRQIKTRQNLDHHIYLLYFFKNRYHEAMLSFSHYYFPLKQKTNQNK